jgi:hypothetical protein
MYDDSTPLDLRFESSAAAEYDLARAAQIQDDGEGARWQNVDGLWRLKPLKSKTVNMNDEGVRKTVGGRTGGLRIAVTGGSAAFGLGAGDDMTIASILNEFLNTDDATVDVVNLGVPAWTMSDAADDLQMRFERGETFDIVISYAGANEITLSFLNTKVPTQMLDKLIEFDGRPSTGFISWWADHSLLSRLSGREPRPEVSPLRRNARRLAEVAQSYDDLQSPRGKRVGDIARYNYEEGDRQLRELSERYGFELLQVVQPLQSDVEPGFTLMLKTFAVENVKDKLDLSGSLEDSCYYDSVHTSEPCNAIVAKAIADELRARGWVS